MLALTVRQPWAHLIASRGKWIENRTKAPPKAALGERIAIHAGLHGGFKYEEHAVFRGGKWLELPAILPDLPPPHELVRGAVVATATLTGWVAEEPHRPGTPATKVARHEGLSLERAQAAIASEWWQGPFGWVLDDVVEISPPSSCKGALGLWLLGRFTEREVAIREEGARAG